MGEGKKIPWYATVAPNMLDNRAATVTQSIRKILPPPPSSLPPPFLPPSPSVPAPAPSAFYLWMGVARLRTVVHSTGPRSHDSRTPTPVAQSSPCSTAGAACLCHRLDLPHAGSEMASLEHLGGEGWTGGTSETAGAREWTHLKKKKKTPSPCRTRQCLTLRCAGV